jgi:thioredoxin reductase (NADPH)
MYSQTFILLYLLPLLIIVLVYTRTRRRRRAEFAETYQQAIAAGLTEPASLHPVVDPNRCIGSGGCVPACPERAIGIVGGKARLVDASACIGHGACAAACPMEAITLVFGTERRGIDIPYVSPDFETNVPGVYIAGELGGMGLIRKSAEQGRQAIEAIRRRGGSKSPLDVVIVGAGPAGIAAGLGAIQHKMRYRLIEQESELGGTVFHYPRNKVAMTAPVKLPVVGTLKIGEITKEELLGIWQDIVKRTGMKIHFRERMEAIIASPESIEVKTSRGTYATRAVLLAIGRRGTPRKLGVPGEEQSKVVYRLVDAEQYRGKRMLVVGGGDSAVEAAVSLSEESGTRVWLSYRGDAFNRIKAGNRTRLDEAVAGERLTVLLQSTVVRIDADSVEMQTAEGNTTLPNDGVIVAAGGILPTDLLKSVGIRFETKHGTA